MQPSDYDYQTEADRLSQILYSLPASPSETLKAHMRRLGFTIEQLVSKSGVSESTIRRLRSNPSYHTTRTNLFALCIGLQLEPRLQHDLFSKYGISFTCTPEDVLYELLLNTMYQQPLSAVNQYLSDYGYAPLSRGIDELDE